MNGGFAIIMYETGEVTDTLTVSDGSKVKFNMVTKSNYPLEGTINADIKVSETKKFAIHLRVPGWSQNFSATVNGQIYKGVTGKFLTIEREWKTGDKVAISFGMPVQIISGGFSYPNSFAVKRGPQVLSLDASLNPEIKESDEIKLEFQDNIPLKDISYTLPSSWSWKQAYELMAKINGKSQKIILVPFAEAGQTASEVMVWFKSNQANFK